MQETEENQTKTKDPGSAKPEEKCQCETYEPKEIPDTIKRLIKTLEDELNSASPPFPGEAATKFAKDLQDCDKEDKAIFDIVKKYEETYNKLDCSLSEANKNKEDILVWCADNPAKEQILELWKNQYDKKEHDICCAWIDNRKNLHSLRDCLRQSEDDADDAKNDFEAIKAFEKTVKDRLTELKSLYDKAKEYHDAGRDNAVCAVGIEYCAVLVNIGNLQSWAKRCCNGTYTPTTEDDCKKWSPAGFLGAWKPSRLREELKTSLRQLILANYNRFRWQSKWLTAESDTKKSKEDCEKVHKTRREEFIQEAEDVVVQPPGASESSKSPAPPPV